MNYKKDTVAEKTIDTLAELGGSAGAAVAGTVIGTAVAGPAGTAIGAIAGTAIEKVDKNVACGKLLRSDGFFDVSEDIHSHADETFEATLLAAQREYEERKIHT